MSDNVNAFTEKFKRLLAKENRTTLIFIIGIISILLIFLSTFFEKDNEQSQETFSSFAISENTDDYKNKIEKELCEMLGNISGVGEVKVMVTISGTTEYEYAQELVKDNNEKSESYKNQYVLIDNNGKKEALIKKINKPTISGVAVVCNGGDDFKVKERIVRAVSTVLGISSNSVCVVPLKNY